MKESRIDFVGEKVILKPGNPQYFFGSGWQGSGNIPVHTNTVYMKYKEDSTLDVTI